MVKGSKKNKLIKYAGIMSEEEADKLLETIQKHRYNKNFNRIIKLFQDIENPRPTKNSKRKTKKSTKT